MASTVTFQLTGVREMERKMNKIADNFGGKILDSQMKQAKKIRIRAQDEFVPERMGDLRDSGRERIVQGRDTGGRFTSDKIVEITFGDELTAAYALAVHEHPSGFSPPSWRGVTVVFSPPGRGPKYLEKPFTQASIGMDKRIANDLKL